MTRIPRMLPCLALACSMTVTSLWAADPAPTPPAAGAAPAADAPAATPAAPAAPAADAPAATPAPATAPAPGAAPAVGATPAPDAGAPAAAPEIPQNQSLKDDVDDFWHYGKIARYDMAAAFGNKIAARTEPPQEILQAFESTAVAHDDSLDDWLLRWEGIDTGGMKGTAAKLEDVLNKGRRERRALPKYIQENIEALGLNERAYRTHLERLRESGELAVPMMLDYLKDKDPEKTQFKDPIRRALVDLGRSALNPLLAATETKDDELELTLINILSRIGYDVAVPYLSRLAQDTARPGIGIAASSALRRMGADPTGNVSDKFYQLGEKFYYNNASIQADPKAPSAYMWFWGDSGLTFKEVPPAIFSDLMAERECEYALQLGPGTRDSLSLWLCANNKLEVDLPEGATSGVFGPDRPAANYYNVYAGAQYLDASLTRTLQDHNSQVAMKLIKSLGTIVGPSTQGTGTKLDPLVQSMHYPDRLVRFEAAFALASGLPPAPFPGHERVAPLLAEAISQTGSANVLLVAPSQAEEQKLADELKQYGLASGNNASQAFGNSFKLPSIDVIVFPESLGADQIARVYDMAAGSPRLERAAKVIVTASRLSPWMQRALSDPLTIVTQATDAVSLSAAVEEGRKRAGGLPLDEKVATTYAVRAAQTVERLAEGRVPAFDLSVIEPTLLASLSDKRPDVAKAVGDALAYMDGGDIQASLLSVALGDRAPDDVRVSLLKSLSKNAKFFGVHLSTQMLGDLQKQVDTAPNLDVRTAAAEARGALNLPADQAKELIINQAKR